MTWIGGAALFCEHLPAEILAAVGNLGCLLENAGASLTRGAFRGLSLVITRW